MNDNDQLGAPPKAILWTRYLLVVLVIAAGVGLSVAVCMLARGWETREIRAEFRRAAKDRVAIIEGEIRSNLLVLESVRIADIVKSKLASLRPKGIDVYLCDRSAPPGKRFLYFHSARTRKVPYQPANEFEAEHPKGLHYTATLKVGGRQWLIVCTPAPGCPAMRRTWHPWGMPVAGLMITGLLAGYVLIGIRHTARVERLVHQRTSELRQSEERFRSLVETTSDWIWAVDENAIYTYASPGVMDILGYDPQEVIGKTPLDFMPPEEAERVATLFQDGVQARKPMVRFENTNLHKDGRRVILETNGVPILDADGNFRGYRGVDRDITEPKRAEEQLRFSEGKARTISDSALDAVVMIHSNGIISHWNPAAEKMFGYSPAEIIGRRVHEVLAPEKYREKARSGFQHFAESGQGPVVGKLLELEALRKDGSEFPIEISISSVIMDGQWCAVAIIRDTTKRRRAEAELAKAKEAAEAANRAKSEFLANMSHEIRTPMTAILGFTELLMAGDLSLGEQASYLETVHRNGKVLLRLIDDILDLSKIESDKITLELTVCSPRQIVDEVVALMRGRTAEKGLSLEVDYGRVLPETIRTDPVRLRQILVNLVGNAVKFTDRGGVRIAVRCQRRPGARPRMRLVVADTGIGMTADEMARLFEPFTQADTTTTRRFGGTGLGLSISRRLAELLGGDIQAQSEPGSGSIFSLTIDPGPLEGVAMVPIVPASLKATTKAVGPAEAEEPQTLRGRLLLAEDCPDSRRLIRVVLEQSGLEVDEAENGRVACKMASASSTEGSPYDLILMDIQMPDLDGYQAIRRLRRDGWQRPIVALTAHAMAGDRQKCLQAGCDDYVPKPIDRAELLATIARSLGQEAVAPDQPADKQESADEPAGLLASSLLDKAKVAELVQAFSGDLSERAEKIENALQVGDFHSLAELAHQLKGAAGVYGFPQISHAAAAVNGQVKKADDLKQLQAVVSELVDLCRQAVADIREKVGLQIEN